MKLFSKERTRLVLPILGVLVLFVVSPIASAAPIPAGSKLGGRTNLPAGLRLNSRTNAPAAKTNSLAGGKPTIGKTNLLAQPHPAGSLKARATDAVQRLRRSRAFFPAVAGLALCLGAFFLYRAFKPKSVEVSTTAIALAPSKLTVRVPGKKVSATAVHCCNVLEVGSKARQVWQFDARGGNYVLNREQTCLEGEALPSGIVAKHWRALFRPKLNIAWLSQDQVFLRVAQLPQSDFNETLSMVELQLEKLSPIPVTQIVWSLHVFPHVQGNLQTVVVTIVARAVVEEFLGHLEGQGYLADRLELPVLDQLQAQTITEDGAWIYPEAVGGKNSALIAWWYGGILRDLGLLTLPATNRAASLKEQLMQMAWAGELEGWLTSPPTWHLVADVARADWEAALREGLEQPVETADPLPTRQLAALTARRSAASEPRANLLPAEFATRYHQQFVDRLWMRSLLAAGAIYLLYVIFQMSRLGYATYITHQAEDQVAQFAPAYTNSIQLRDRYRVLKDREELKYAGLDCWNTIARLLPESVTLDNMDFREGKRLTLNGSAPVDQIQKLNEFEREMRRFKIPGQEQPFFDPEKGDGMSYTVLGSSASWHLTLELNRSEVQ